MRNGLSYAANCSLSCRYCARTGRARRTCLASLRPGSEMLSLPAGSAEFRADVPAHSAGLLFDLYHLAANGDDLDAAIDAYAGRIGHVQIADHSGRGEPGSGTLDLDHYLAALRAAGYSGYVAAEYIPTTSTQDSLGWFARPERGGS